ncbi:hypothetical protein Leryth_017330 [Lithospermum erythrorhizon]|nr:hypothetical protein Leryth_017330 [Lithospermum erythrorhizon]
MRDTYETTKESFPGGEVLAYLCQIYTFQSDNSEEKNKQDYLLKGTERSKDGPSNPDTVLPLGRCHNLDLQAAGS